MLIVDTDMRKSVLVGRLRAQVESGGTIYGLSHYLSGQVSLDNIVYATTIPRVFIIFAGHEVPNPTELLESKEFAELIKFGEENFDYVLVDTPPTGAAIDAAVVGKNVDGAVVVAAQNATSSRAIINTKRTLEDSGVRILGAVLNKVKFEGSRYGGYYGSYYKGYYGGYGGYYGHYGHDNDDDEDEKESLDFVDETKADKDEEKKIPVKSGSKRTTGKRPAGKRNESKADGKTNREG